DICSFSMMGRIERGERIPDKELRDRILARLGVCSDGYENFLFQDDYELWKREQGIVNAIEKSDYEKAEKLLTYYETIDAEDILGKQFELVMRVQIMQKRHEDPILIAKLCEQAVKLTVKDIDDRSVGELCLSVQELDMILEYERYCHPDKLASRCEEILAYIQSDSFDIYSCVKIYPKVVYYLYTSTPEKDRDWNRMLRICNIGIEQLRTANRMYYLWELLEIRKEGMAKLLEDTNNNKNETRKQATLNVINTTIEWLDALDFVHNLCGTHRTMESSCYLYQQKEAYCISDVIRRRREMLGYTKKKLCEGICSEKTIGRLEAKTTKPQIKVVRELFKRLNLSGEYQRWQIVTDDVRAFSLYDEILRSINNGDLAKTERLLNKLECYVSMENPINRQYKERIKVIVKQRQGIISKEETIDQLINILENTIPYEVAIEDGIKYLTNVEMQILLDIANNEGKTHTNRAFEMLVKLCAQMEYDEGISEHIAAWETIMTHIANIYGSREEYTRSDLVSLRTMKECIYCRRMNVLALNLYIVAWNNG
ncbi:MAG: helix-turn-helix transcriptional regulator, partial [Lachnospiraceae bacterium]|nr:helix-turn-helix transcriptional regulator [Lachnospiraceae bacterium]